MDNVIYIKVKHRCVAKSMNFMSLENYEPPFLLASNYINFGHAMNPRKCPQLNEWKWRFFAEIINFLKYKHGHQNKRSTLIITIILYTA